jgi:hypothetical protein
MEQRVIKILNQVYGMSRTEAQQAIVKAQTYYKWPLRQGDTATSVGWVISGAQNYDKHISTPLPKPKTHKSKINQVRRELIQTIQTTLQKTPIEAQSMVKYVEQRFGKLKYDTLAKAWNYFFKQFNENQFINYMLDRPAEYYDCLFVINQGNKMKPASQQQIQKLKQQQQLYQTYAHSKKSHQQQQLQKECAICMTEFENTEKIIHLPCKHIFHTDCITEWLKHNKICPVCKKQINKRQQQQQQQKYQ